MKRFLLVAVALCFASMPAKGVVYYVSNSGSDTHSGKTPAAAWKTVAKVNGGCQSDAFKPGDSIVFKRGGLWHEQLTCGNASFTLNSPPNFAGVTVGAYGVGAQPILDAANPLGAVTWKRVSADPSGRTWQTEIPQNFFDTTGPTNGQPIRRILKLYMDGEAKETIQILPVSNFTGPAIPDKNYEYLDAVEQEHGRAYVSGSPLPHAYPPNGGATMKFWAGNDFKGTGIASLTGKGLDNVIAGYVKPADRTQNYQAYPGVWWSDGKVLYVNLGGLDPNQHRFEGTVRVYGVLLENAEKAVVQDLAVEHSYASGIEAIPIALNTGAYKSTEYMVFRRNRVWNFAGILTNEQISFAGQGQNGDMGGIQVRWDGMQDFAKSYKLPGVVISDNVIGTADLLFGSGIGHVAGILADGLDSGKVTGNFVKTQLGSGLSFNNASMGYVAGNELTWNYGNYFANSYCGQMTHNYIHEFWAEGIQIGGGVPNSKACVQDISENIIVNGFINATGALYNGIDCNGAALNAGFHIHHNTIINVWGAGITNESINGSPTTGCQAATIDSNIIDMPHPYFPAANSINNSNAYYFSGAANLPQSMHNNLLILNGERVRIAGGQFGGDRDNSDWLAKHDIGSHLFTSEPAGLWMNYSAHDFRRRPNSPVAGADAIGADPRH